MRGLVELASVQDIYVSGLGAIENVGGSNLRFIMYVNEESDDGTIQKVVVARLIAPISALPDTVMSLVAAMNGKLVELIVPALGNSLN